MVFKMHNNCYKWFRPLLLSRMHIKDLCNCNTIITTSEQTTKSNRKHQRKTPTKLVFVVVVGFPTWINAHSFFHVQDYFPFFAIKCYLHHLWIINFLSPFIRCFALWNLLEFHHLWITKNDWQHWKVIEIDPHNCSFRVSFTQNWSPQPLIYPSTWNWSPLSIIRNDL